VSSRSIYLRDQADKCRWHAGRIGNAEMQVKLRKLAAEYVVRAEEIENKEKSQAASVGDIDNDQCAVPFDDYRSQ
jgi:hypothetical protein